MVSKEELEKAAIAMCRKLTAIDRSESMHGIFTFAMVHGQLYDGPNYSEDLKNLMAVIPEEIAKEIRELPEEEWRTL